MLNTKCHSDQGGKASAQSVQHFRGNRDDSNQNQIGLHISPSTTRKEVGQLDIENGNGIGNGIGILKVLPKYSIRTPIPTSLANATHCK